jgi:cytochrome c2
VLGAWISSPATMVPGSPMAIFEGVAERDKDDLIAYLATQK